MFHQKLQLFLANLKNGVYHNGKVVNGVYVPDEDTEGKYIVYIMQVIEYQHRGLPHAHVVYRVHYEHKPNAQPLSADEQLRRQEITRQRIDGFEETNDEGETIIHLPEVMAYRPPECTKEASERNAEEEAQCILDAIVSENNQHKCSPACKATPDAECKRGFDRFIVQEKTTFKEKNKRPIYARPTRRDLRTVAYKASMMLDWNGHMNVESATNERSVAYLYNYLFKGIGKVMVELRKKAALEGVENPQQGKQKQSILLSI